MSLLMDALKKAELAKRKAQLDLAPGTDTTTSDAPDPATAQPEPTAQTPSASFDFDALGATAPSLRPSSDSLELAVEGLAKQPAVEVRPATARSTLSLQALDERTVSAAGAASATASAAPPQSPAQRDSVKNLFESKQPAASRKMFAIAVGVTTLLAIAAIGVYFWMQLQPRSGLLARSQQSPAPSAALNPSSNQPSPSTQPEPANPVFADTEETGTAQVDDVEAEASSNSRIRSEPEEGISVAPPAPRMFRMPAARPATNTTLDRAYEALMQGNDAQAKTAYEQALAADPKNTDALSGLAVVAQRAGNPGLAAEYYLQVLDADPRNATAMSGLINLQSRMSPAEAESRIKQSLATQPDSPALHFSLGNVYARSKRWNEAQEAYFKAMSGDPGNPDYLFNLAVSLDQLRQPRLAANYYAQAVAAANSRPSSFDRAQAAARLQQLQ